MKLNVHSRGFLVVLIVIVVVAIAVWLRLGASVAATTPGHRTATGAPTRTAVQQPTPKPSQSSPPTTQSRSTETVPGTSTEPILRSGPTTTAGVITAASFKGTVSYADGVRVSVLHVKRTKLSGKDVAPHTKKGAAIQIVKIRVQNGSRVPLSVSVRTRTLTYGPHHKAAPAVYGPGITSMSGSIRPGGSKTGTFASAVPKRYLNTAALSFSFSPSHQPAVFSGSLQYSPGNGTTFNDPNGSKAEVYAIIWHIERSIDATAKGATIRIAHYSFDMSGTADRLVAAHRRGVHVQMIVDKHEDLTTSETARLIKELGQNRKKKSFLVRCRASCMSSHTSAMHAKFYLFSSVGSSRSVSMISSANLTHTNSSGSWNDIQTIVGEPALYDSLTQYFKDMAPDKNRPHYYRTTTTSHYKLYFFPRAPHQDGNRVTLLDVLDHVSCSGVASGYGRDGHTVIRVGMYSWTSKRIDIARRLWDLHNQGCQVQIVYNSRRTSNAITYTLLRESKKHGQLDLHDAWVDRNGDNSPNQYMHEKVLTINGVWYGHPNTKVVYAGSQNYTPNATVDNNDLIFRNIDDATYDAYAKNFRSILKDTRRIHHNVGGFTRDTEE